MADHKPCYVLVIVLTIVVYAITLVFNYLATAGNNNVFHNATGSVSQFYFLEVTPAGWTFAVLWSIIYLWQAAWLTYALSTVWRRSAYGYLYVNPCHISMALYPCFMLNNVTNFTWLIVWDRFLPVYALILLTVSAVSLYLGLFFSFRRIYQTGSALIQEKLQKDIWLTRILVHNGLAFYATWVTIATLINLSVVIAYIGGVDQSFSSTVCLCLVAFFISIWFFLDTVPLDQYVRYTFTPYLVVIIALTGSISKNWDPKNNNSALTAFILAAACIGTVIKVALTLWRHRARPIFVELPLLFNSNSTKSYGSYDYTQVSVK